jgi:two-component system CheB/CheR fusion protein
MLEAILQRAGYEVHCAHDGRAGLEVIRRVRPNIAIVDIGLPGMDGYELGRHVRAREEHQDLYMVALTGYGRPSDRTAALEAGFNDHLIKPLHPDDLDRLLRSQG